jgi:hypothetical protein
MLIVATGLGGLPRAAGAALTALLVVSGWPGVRNVVFTEIPRPFQPMPQVAARLDTWAREPGQAALGLVIVHSVPTGVIGLARYVTAPLPMASWIIRLRRYATPGEAEAIIAGYCRVALVEMHTLGDPTPAQAWLRANARFEREEWLGGVAILYFTVPASYPRESATCLDPVGASR